MYSNLSDKYIEWAESAEKIDNGYFLNDKFSNPYYAGIQTCKNKKGTILIVGEEGFGLWGSGKADGWNFRDIERISEDKTNYIRVNLGKENGYNKSMFWNRFRYINEVTEGNYNFAWTNIDKIHYLSNERGKAKLNEKDRIKLHGTEIIPILRYEIEMINPQCIVFFGWYGISLKAELPGIFEIVYPHGLEDTSMWKNKVLSFDDNGIRYVFSYHPASNVGRTNEHKESIGSCIKNFLL